MNEFFDECMAFVRQEGVFAAILTSIPFVVGFISYFFTREKERDALPSILPPLEHKENILPKEEKKAVRPTIVVGRKPVSTWSLL